jgi:hypothetical protein
MNEASDTSVPTTEGSPLTYEKRSTRKPRRRFSAEILVDGIKRAFGAFEYEMAQNPIDEVDDVASDTESSSDAELDQHAGRSNLCPSCNKIALLVLLLGMAYAIGSWSAQRSSFRIESTSCGDPSGPLMALKESSYIDGLENGAVAADHEVCSAVGNVSAPSFFPLLVP